MTRDAILALGKDPPILCADGQFGLVIRCWATSVGVQVRGEEHIREIPFERVELFSGGALMEVQDIDHIRTFYGKE